MRDESIAIVPRCEVLGEWGGVFYGAIALNPSDKRRFLTFMVIRLTFKITSGPLPDVLVRVRVGFF
jgi:hypothetical protein